MPNDQGLSEADYEKFLDAQPTWVKEGLFPEKITHEFQPMPAFSITRDAGSSPPVIPVEAMRVTRSEADDDDEVKPDTSLPPAIQPPACPTSGTITAVFSGTAPCGCKAVGLIDSQQVTTFSGLTGSHTLTWDGVAHFSLLGIGVFEVTLYADTICSSIASVSTDTFDILAQCSDGLWTVTVQGSTALANIFTTGTPEPLGSPISNALTCVAGPTGNLIGDGACTLS